MPDVCRSSSSRPSPLSGDGCDVCNKGLHRSQKTENVCAAQRVQAFGQVPGGVDAILEHSHAAA